MADDSKSERANEVLRVNLTVLREAIVNAGLRQFVDECERKGLVTEGLKDTLVSSSTGRTDAERASTLIDSIRRSLSYDPGLVLGDFLCIIFSTGGQHGQALARRIAIEYGHKLKQFSKLVEQHKKIGNATNTPASQQDLNVRNLVLALRDLVKWEEFALNLPGIKQSDVTRIKRENIEDIEGQKRTLFDKWLRVDPSASWKAVEEALETSGETVLAEKIRGTKGESPRGTMGESPNSSTGAAPTSPWWEENSTDGCQPDQRLDPKQLYLKSPSLDDVLEVVPRESDCPALREALAVPIEGDLKTAIELWISTEPSDVTWKKLVQALRTANKIPTAKYIATTYLRRPSVYRKYIELSNFESFDDLGL